MVNAFRNLSLWMERHAYLAMGVIAAVAILLRVLVVYRLGMLEHVFSTEVPNVASALLNGRGFADAYGPGTGPTAHVAPVYPFLLAGVYGIFGFARAGIVAQTIFALLQVAAILFLLVPLALACGMPRVSALWGGLLYAIPVSPSAESGGVDTMLIALWICAAAIGAIGLCKRGTWSVREAVCTGLFCGLALLSGPPLALWFGVSALLGLFFLRSGAFAGFLLIASGITIAVLLPWMIRNELALGSPIWSRSNFGLEFNLSHNDHARVQWQDYYDDGWVEKLHPSASSEESRRVMQIGEVAYNREKLRQGLHWVYTHPAQEASLSLGRIFRFWFPTLKKSRIQTIVTWGGTIAGLIGFALWFRRTEASAWIMAALFFAFPLTYYLIYTTNRYRYPVVPVLLLFAGDMIRRLGTRFAT
jgi:hypothetical protein